MENKKKKALITGIDGQSGSYLTELLLEKGYEVWGTLKRNSVAENQTYRLNGIYDRIASRLMYADVTDVVSLYNALIKSQPDEIYNLAAQSHVRISFDQPLYTANATGLSVLNLLEAVRSVCPNAKVYQASSSEMFGNSIDSDGFQRETTPMNPVSPYGCFPKGTKILFKSKNEKIAGRLVECTKNKNIEDIKVDDEVLSYNTVTGKKEWKKVLNTMIRQTNELYIIKFSNGNFIECTEEHPFYIHGKEWVEAKDLKIGDTAIQYKYSGLNSRCNIGKTYEEMYLDSKVTTMKENMSNKMKDAWNNTSTKLDRSTYSQMMRSKVGLVDVWNKGLTKETDDRIRKRSEEMVGQIRTKSTKEKISKTVKKLWKDDEYISKVVNSRCIRPNKHEKYLLEILNDVCPSEFEYNGGYEKKIMIDRKIPDFVHVSKKKVIEYFGEYWHNKEYKDDEQTTIKKYNNQGYDCLVIWEKDLFTNAETTKKRILDFLYNKNTETVQIISIEKCQKKCDVYNFEVADNNNYFAYGILVHNCAKVFGYNIARNYRNSYGLFVSNGILFNHESPRRGTNFVTNKVVKEAVRIKAGLSNQLVLGNLDACRDWGHAKDYVEAMWRILQLETPNDYICATGVSHSVKELCEYTFGQLDLDWKEYVTTSEKYLRPEELNVLKGDSNKLRRDTGWQPEYTFETMIDDMISYWTKEYKL